MKLNKYYFIKITQLVIGLVSVMLCGFGKVDDSYKNLLWIPITFTLVILIVKNKKRYDLDNIAYIVIDFLATLKYAIIPIIMVIYDDFGAGVLTGQIPSKKYIDQAIILQIIEIITIYVVLMLYPKKEIKEVEIKTHPVGKVMIIFFVLAAGLALIYWDNFVPSQIFLIDNNYVSNRTIDAKYDGAISIILNMLKILILLIGIQYCYKKYKENNRLRYVLASGIILLVYIALNTGTSRWSIVFPFIVCTYLFIKMYKEKAKIMIISILSIVIISVISITFVKFNWLLDENSSMNDLIEVYAKQMQEYFSGIRPTAQGVQVVDIYGSEITYKTLINDFIGSVPLVANYVDQDNRINIYYNYLLKGIHQDATQIMPMITIGLAYFGYPLSSIFIIFCLCIALKFGEKVKTSEDFFKKYIYCLFLLWFSMCIGFNTQILVGNFISTFVPFMIIVKLDDVLLKKNEKYLKTGKEYTSIEI